MNTCYRRASGAGVILTVLVTLVFLGASGARAQINPTDSLPYGDEKQERTTPPLYHAGLMMLGIRGVDDTGLGIIGFYGDRSARFDWGGEAILGYSGERRIPSVEASNSHYAAEDLYVYEEIGMVGLGGSAYLSLIKTPRSVGLHMPGITLGMSGGVMIETDRVGLQSSDVELYYGYGSSDTDLSLRPYIRPQLIFSQGPLSVVSGVAVFPVFASWSVGLAYGW